MNRISLDCRLGVALFFLVAVVCGSGCVDLMPGEPEVRNVTPDQAAALIQERAGDPNFVILDVRNPDEFATGHLQDAVNLCYLCSTFTDSIASLDKSTTYLVYCGSEHRSSLAAEAMKNAGFTSLYNLTGGLATWQGQGRPIAQ